MGEKVAPVMDTGKTLVDIFDEQDEQVILCPRCGRAMKMAVLLGCATAALNFSVQCNGCGFRKGWADTRARVVNTMLLSKLGRELREIEKQNGKEMERGKMNQKPQMDLPLSGQLTELAQGFMDGMTPNATHTIPPPPQGLQGLPHVDLTRLTREEIEAQVQNINPPVASISEGLRIEIVKIKPHSLMVVTYPESITSVELSHAHHMLTENLLTLGFSREEVQIVFVREGANLELLDEGLMKRYGWVRADRG